MNQIPAEALERIQKAAEERSTHLDLRSLQLTHVPKELLELSAFLTSLDLIGNRIQPDAIQDIARLVPHIESLYLADNQIEDEGAKAIAEHLKQLTSLELSFNQIGDEGVKAIAQQLTQLANFGLSYNQIGEKGAKAIAKYLRELTYLNLFSNQIGDEGAKAIAKYLTELTNLNLSRNQISDEGVKVIAEYLKGLRVLELSGNQISDGGTKAIAEYVRELTNLNLSSNQIGDEGAKAIAENLKKNLTNLDLSVNYIGTEGARTIAENLKRLTNLDLLSNQIGDEGAKAIAEHLTQLTELNLSYNQISDEGVKTIAGHLKQLTNLKLFDNKIGEEGVKAIAEHITQLTELNLSCNQIGDEGAKAIAERLIQLTYLDLSVNNIGAEGAKAIAERLIQLTYLNLSDNQIGDEGAKIIAKHLTQLVNLSLSRSQIGDEGAKGIANGGLKHLTYLNLSFNQIGNEGVKSIAEHLTQLTKLSLSSNQIGNKGAKAIADHLKNLIDLDLSNNQFSDEGAKAIVEQLSKLFYLNFFSNNNGDVWAHIVAKQLPQLKMLLIQNNKIGNAGAKAIAESLLPGSIHEKLTDLHWWGNSITIFPREILLFDTAKKLRAWMQDLQKGSILNNEIKLIFIGNGRVGKSSVLERLETEHCPLEMDSTHGIYIRSWEKEDILFRAWDFGGQDIYHATHRIFLRSKAVFILVWDAETEAKARNGEKTLEIRGDKQYEFENFTLGYWLDSIRSLSPESPVLVIQNKTDAPGHQKIALQLPGIENPDHYHAISAHQGGPAFGTMEAALINMVQAVPDFGFEMPASWGAVRTIMLDGVQHKYLPDELELSDFETFCEEKEVPETSRRILLDYLHDSGVIFYQKELFSGRILLNQERVLRAIYQIFNRDNFLHKITVKGDGRFSIRELREEEWRIYSLPECRQFLGFMQACEMCFALGNAKDENDEFVVTQMLQEKQPENITDLWAEKLKSSKGLFLKFNLDFFHYVFIQRFIVRCGKHIHPDWYWRYGIRIKTGDGAEALVVADKTSQRSSILLSVVGERQKDLLSALHNMFAEIIQTAQRPRLEVSADGQTWKNLESVRETYEEFSDESKGKYAPFLSFDEHLTLESTDTGLHIKRNLPGEPILPPVKIEIVKEQAPEKAGQIKNVFISYAHADDGAKEKVHELADRLIKDGGVDVFFDRYIHGDPPEGWQKWMQTSIDQADYILVVFTSAYRKRWDKEEEPGIGRGVTRESMIIEGQLYKAGGLNTKVRPLVLQKEDKKWVPDIFIGYTTYCLPEDYDELYFLITDQPAHVKPEPKPGNIRKRSG